MTRIKEILGNIPYAAELYWQFRQKNSPTTVGLNLSRLQKELPAWVEIAAGHKPAVQTGRTILVFGMINYWLEYSTLLSLSLAAMGHQVTFGYVPYAHWRKEERLFDVRRQNVYIREILKPAARLIDVVSLFAMPAESDRFQDPDLVEIMKAQAFRDTQYSLLTEEVEIGSDLYNLRLARDSAMLTRTIAYLRDHQPDVIITPNGSILEFGTLYHAARYLKIPINTFEFGEQNYRMWLAQDDDVMRQDTAALWQARGQTPLTDTEWQQVRSMFEARQGAAVWKTFERTWQTAESQGAQKIRSDLQLDIRPLAFLPTNVLGDSLTLGRQIFIGMTDWIRRTIRWFGAHPEYQLVVRVHPGEQIGWGPSTYDLLKAHFPEFPDNVRVLPADFKVNSYDLVEAASVGLVYTTTMGMEMAMIGKPVIVLGQTHYRDKGFTQDPADWEAFKTMLSGALQDPENFTPSSEAVEKAWTYAYRFFFEYPQPFPWHIQHFWKCLETWPLNRVLAADGQNEFGQTFAHLIGEKPLFITD